MKKIFTLFAAALVGLCAFADDTPCPSKCYLSLLNADDPANVEIELQLTNESANLNGFNLELTKDAGSEAIAWKRVQGLNYFTAKGYAPVILGMLAENMGMAFSDEELEGMLGDMADIKSSLKPNDPINGNLVMIEILSTNDCRFFPQLATPTGVGKFKVDMSNCEDRGEDNPYHLIAPAVASNYSFAYTGGPEGNRAWTGDEPLELYLTKNGNVIEEYTGISTIAVDRPVDNRIFDLQGRELQSIPEHGIYIQNGKKYVK